jgi:uncharacterized membrane protein HdeD (DUF308 family)
MPIMESAYEKGGMVAEDLDRHYGLFLMLGIVLMVAGVLAISSNLFATLASVVFFGFLFVVSGISQIVIAFSSGRWKGVALHLMLGVLSVVCGIILFRAPLMGAATLTLVIATWLLASGFGEALHALFERYEHWGMAFMSGVVGMALGGILLASWPVSSLWFLGLYLGIQLLFQGVRWTMVAFSAHREVAHLHAPA